MAKEIGRRSVPVSGWYACLALFEKRPEDIERIVVDRKKTKLLGKVLSWAAGRRLPYRSAESAELARIAGTSHHEGVVFFARERTVPSFSELDPASVPTGALLVALDSVANPHNLGAILRTCAFFGVDALLLGGEKAPPRLSPAVLRTSQGGAEEVPVFRARKLDQALSELRSAGFFVVGTDVFGKDIYTRGRKRNTAERSCLVLGNESTGLSPEVREACDELLRVPGRGGVESLNVSVACGVFLALMVRSRKSEKSSR